MRILQGMNKPFCEHCGDLEPGTTIIDDEGVTWCRCCADANGLIDIDDEKWAQVNHDEIICKIDYHKRKIEDLEYELQASE